MIQSGYRMHKRSMNHVLIANINCDNIFAIAFIYHYSTVAALESLQSASRARAHASLERARRLRIGARWRQARDNIISDSATRSRRRRDHFISE